MTKQKSGDNSVNVQAHQVNMGLSYSEVREVAEDLFKKNFYELKMEAVATVLDRVGKFIESLLVQIKEKCPDRLNAFNDPDIQSVLLEAEKATARTDDSNMEELLIDVIIERIKEDKKELKQIVLNESISIIPKLMSYQYDILSLIFIIRMVKLHKVQDMSRFKEFLETFLVPFIDNIKEDLSCYLHLDYTGCVVTSIGSLSIENAMKYLYPGLFSKGMIIDEYKSLFSSFDIENTLVQCTHDESLYRFNSADNEGIKFLLKGYKIENDVIERIIAFQNKSILPDAKIKEVVIAQVPELEKLFDVWNKSQMKHLNLTSVGIAIAVANIKRKISADIDLSIWISG